MTYENITASNPNWGFSRLVILASQVFTTMMPGVLVLRTHGFLAFLHRYTLLCVSTTLSSEDSSSATGDTCCCLMNAAWVFPILSP